MHKHLHLLRLKLESTNSASETWKFHCNECEYQGTYQIDATSGHREVKIIDRGNKDASHYSNHLFSLWMEGFIWERPERQEEDSNWDSWLTAESREKLDDILSDLDA